MKFIYRCLYFVLLPAITWAQHDTSYYSVVNKSKIAGSEKMWQSVNGDYHISYQFNDRGRGDSTETVLHVNADGNISSLLTTGIDYYKNPFQEQYAIHGDSAVWTINGDRKAVVFNNQLYSPSGGSPVIFEILLKAIMRQPHKKMATLPDGNIGIGETMDKSLNINGKNQQLRLFTMYFDPSPVPYYLWMTDDMHFFAFGTGWSYSIQKGCEKWVDSLFAMQEIASSNYYRQQLKNNSSALMGRMLFTHANIFQSATAGLQNNMTIEVVNGKIAGIFPAAAAPAKADTVIDCTGKFIMPGLWDMHGHYDKDEGVMYLGGGVTHVRDMGNDKILLTYKKQIADNALLGPDISYLSGFIDKEDPFQAPTGAIIKTLEEGLTAIDDYHNLGYQQIKLYSAVKPEWVKPLAAHAHSLGMRVCGHIPAFMTAEQAINAGYDEITHMNFLFLNFMGDTIDTRTPARFRLVGDNAGSLDLQSAAVQKFIALMKQKHIALDATLNVWQGMFDEFKGDTSGFIKPVFDWLPAANKTSVAVQSPFGSEQQKVAYKAAFKNMLNMLKMLYDNGILLVPGTDGGDANALHHELELYVKAGIPAAEVLKIATYNAALDCNLQNVYGQVLPGRLADFIIIDGDPIKDISAIRRVRNVVKNNRLYQPKQLLQSQGWTYYY